MELGRLSYGLYGCAHIQVPVAAWALVAVFPSSYQVHSICLLWFVTAYNFSLLFAIDNLRQRSTDFQPHPELLG